MEVSQFVEAQEELNDYADYYQHSYAQRSRRDVSSSYRMPMKKDGYHEAKQVGLEDFSKYFGLSPDVS
jgi:hypothetical protein